MPEPVKPQSPRVNFEIINNNIFQNNPLSGVTFVAAVTTKGTPNKPDEVIRTFSKFKELYGEEIVPDGSISNIEIALKLGSNLRVSKVEHSGELGKELTTSANWIKALEALKEYNEGYQLTCSGINQWFKTTESQAELDKVHIAAAARVNEIEDMIYYIEVPKYSLATVGNEVKPMEAAEMITWVKKVQEKVLNSRYVAYFAGGWKYYDNQGNLKDCDSIGTVIGLGDASSSNYGPWYSFAGQNRGLVKNARGIVSPNYGADALYDKINELAENYINISVIKDTRNSGKSPMLWHNFTSSNESNSFQYLGIVRLVLYLRKILKPVMDSYLEEPNIFSTWNTMYYDVKPIFDDLITQNAITQYEWLGDQNASSYDELVVNTEADVRKGKYRAELHFKEVVSMQEITISLIIDKSEQSTSVEVASVSNMSANTPVAVEENNINEETD